VAYMSDAILCTVGSSQLEPLAIMEHNFLQATVWTEAYIKQFFLLTQRQRHYVFRLSHCLTRSFVQSDIVTAISHEWLEQF